MWKVKEAQKTAYIVQKKQTHFAKTKEHRTEEKQHNAEEQTLCAEEQTQVIDPWNRHTEE